MNARLEREAAEAVAHARVAAAALAGVGALGAVHAVWFAWAGQPSFIEPPALAVMSTTFFVVAAWMAYVPPAAVRVR